jgi:hypothetical protein
MGIKIRKRIYQIQENHIEIKKIHQGQENPIKIKKIIPRSRKRYHDQEKFIKTKKVQSKGLR